jgi:hypothetical protein
MPAQLFFELSARAGDRHRQAVFGRQRNKLPGQSGEFVIDRGSSARHFLAILRYAESGD